MRVTCACVTGVSMWHRKLGARRGPGRGQAGGHCDPELLEVHAAVTIVLPVELPHGAGRGIVGGWRGIWGQFPGQRKGTLPHTRVFSDEGIPLGRKLKSE